jgi:hypothetical protein
MTMPTPLVHVLCCARSSVYRAIPGADCYTRAKDTWSARPYRPCLAHPPCRAWSRSRARCTLGLTARLWEMMLGIHCANLVKRFGGILEQPAHSRLFAAAGLPVPGTSANVPGLWSISLDQANYGHRSAKPTWLCLANIKPRQVTLVEFTLAASALPHLNSLTPGQRSATPRPFAELLVRTASLACSAP